MIFLLSLPLYNDMIECTIMLIIGNRIKPETKETTRKLRPETTIKVSIMALLDPNCVEDVREVCWEIIMQNQTEFEKQIAYSKNLSNNLYVEFIRRRNLLVNVQIPEA